MTVNRKDFVGPTLGISNILVHENFKSPASKNSPENNDLGKLQHFTWLSPNGYYGIHRSTNSQLILL